jgi:glycosyltransferase involved in cell wall biosynthesis
MRVYVIEASGRGGMIQYDYHLCRALQRQGIDTTLITSTSYELRDLPHEFRVVELLHLWDPRGARPASQFVWKLRRATRGLRYIVEWLRLIVFLLYHRPNVVLFGELRFRFEYYFLLILKLLGFHLAAIVHDVRTYDHNANSGKITRDSAADIRAYTRMYQQFFALFVHDRTNYDLFLSLYPAIPAEQVHQIHLATWEVALEVAPSLTADQLRTQFAIPIDHPTALFFGTITKYKGLDILLRAFPKVCQQTSAHLIVVGFPSNEVNMDAMKQLADDLGIADSVSWYLDYLPNEQIKPLMEITNIVVLPYRMVAQSGVLQIAYAYGKPVVATEVGGLPDVIEDGQSGLLVPPENPDALAEAMLRLIEQPSFAEKLGARARELSQTRFSWQAVAECMKSVFESV